jgi:hypothetical protein
MAAINASSAGFGGLIGPLGATVAGGDDFGVSEGDTLIYHNGTASPVTVTLAAVAALVQPNGGFPVAPGNKAFVIPAGEFLILPLSGQNLTAYQNLTTGRVAVTYIGHGALLKCSIIRRG